MRNFNRRIVPIIVILNFIFSFQMLSQLKYRLILRELDHYGWVSLITGLLLMIIINVVVVAVIKKKYGYIFSVSAYIVFVIIIPIISLIIMFGLVGLITNIANILGVGFSLV